MSVSVIVAGSDGSKAAAHALTWTADLASQTGAKVVVVHTFEPLAHIEEERPPYDFRAAEQRVRSRLETEWIEPLTRVGVDPVCRLVHGAPWQCLMDVADEEDADVIVVGSRGFGLLRGMALGSTSMKLIHASTRPVVVIPPA